MRIVLVILLALGLGGCETMSLFTGDKSILSGGTSILAETQNPIGPQQLAVIEASYRAALVTAVNYRRYCYSKPVAELPGFCANRRGIVTLMQRTNQKVRVALVALRKFAKSGDNVNAIGAFAAAKAALQEFQQVAAVSGVT